LAWCFSKHHQVAYGSRRATMNKVFLLINFGRGGIAKGGAHLFLKYIRRDFYS